ncbi:MAG TPA: T9SS type A sorting domain-containing protein [Bacteroidetes bacterium]|nr:T9SS type A sorting domain-containing protein [Bacteroidota bacterium]
MNAGHLRTILFIGLFLSSFSSLFAQIELKLQLLPDGNSWGVYVRPQQGLFPSDNLQIPTAQVTVVMPVDFEWAGLISHHGIWVDNSNVVSPVENEAAKYVSFGLQNSDPGNSIPLVGGQETLLFSFQKVSACPAFLHLIDCNTPSQSDPFCFPNSLNINSGNDMTVFDFGQGFAQLYFFTDNYNLAAWDCHDADGDGIPNALEDTNGNGLFDPGEDASDLFDPNDPGGNGGLQFSLKLMPGGEEWGVFTKPAEGILPTANTTTHDGHVRIVAPLGFEFGDLTSHAGTWVAEPAVDGPPENEERSYLGFTLLADDPPIRYSSEEPTLLFTLKKENACPGLLNILDEETDPLVLACEPSPDDLCIFNKLNVTDHGTVPESEYFYAGNYATAAWDCRDNDNDGIPNAFEDSDGDGTFTEDDSSDLNDPCDPNRPLSAVLTYTGETLICSGQTVDDAFLMVDVEGVLSSAYDVEYTDGQDVFLVHGYHVGEQIPVVPFAGAEYRLLSVADVNGCDVEGELDGNIKIETEGTLEITAQPVDLAACSGSQACFSLAANNDAGDEISYQWQGQQPGAIGWLVLLDNASAQGATTSQLCIGNTSGMDGYRFRAVVKSGLCNELVSEPARLFVESPVAILAQPEDQEILGIADAHFSAELFSESGSPITYQWQQSADGMTWTEVLNGTFGENTFAGANSSSLLISPATGLDGMQYRLAASTPVCGEVLTDPADLSVNLELVTIVEDIDFGIQYNCENSFFAFQLKYHNTEGVFAEVTWETSADGINWTAIPNNTPPYMIDHDRNYDEFYPNGFYTFLGFFATADLDGMQYRCRLESGSGQVVYSSTAILDITGLPTINTQPESTSTCFNEGHVFTAEVNDPDGLPLQFEWQMSSGGLLWQPIADNSETGFGGVFENTQTESLTITSVEGLDGYRFRLHVGNGTCETVSEAAILTVEDLPSCYPAAPKLDYSIVPSTVSERWLIMVKAAEDYVPSGYNKAQSGRFVIAASNGFVPGDLLSLSGGEWKPGMIKFNDQETPGITYFTFDLTPGNNNLNLLPGSEVPLLSFKSASGCPDALYLADGYVPSEMLPNEFTAIDLGNYPHETVGLRQIYGQQNAGCGNNGSFLLSNPQGGTGESASAAAPVSKMGVLPATGNAGFKTPLPVVPSSKMRAYPNPAVDFINISLPQTMPEGNARYSVISANGAVLRAVPAGGFTQKIMLDELPAGLYFITLEVDGKVLDRQRFVKR